MINRAFFLYVHPQNFHAATWDRPQVASYEEAFARIQADHRQETGGIAPRFYAWISAIEYGTYMDMDQYLLIPFLVG